MHAATDKTLLPDKSAPVVETIGSRLVEGSAVGPGDVLPNEQVTVVSSNTSLVEAIRKEKSEEGSVAAVEVEATPHPVSAENPPATPPSQEASPSTETFTSSEAHVKEKGGRSLSLAELQALTDLTQVSAVSPNNMHHHYLIEFADVVCFAGDKREDSTGGAEGNGGIARERVRRGV